MFIDYRCKKEKLVVGMLTATQFCNFGMVGMHRETGTRSSFSHPWKYGGVVLGVFDTSIRYMLNMCETMRIRSAARTRSGAFNRGEHQNIDHQP